MNDNELIYKKKGQNQLCNKAISATEIIQYLCLIIFIIILQMNNFNKDRQRSFQEIQNSDIIISEKSNSTNYKITYYLNFVFVVFIILLCYQAYSTAIKFNKTELDFNYLKQRMSKLQKSITDSSGPYQQKSSQSYFEQNWKAQLSLLEKQIRQNIKEQIQLSEKNIKQLFKEQIEFSQKNHDVKFKESFQLSQKNFGQKLKEEIESSIKKFKEEIQTKLNTNIQPAPPAPSAPAVSSNDFNSLKSQVADLTGRFNGFRLKTIRNQRADVKAITYTQLFIQNQLRNLFPKYQQQYRTSPGYKYNVNFTTDYYQDFPLSGHAFSIPFSQAIVKFCKQMKVTSILDFGCGKCEYVQQLTKNGINAEGFDANSVTNNITNGKGVQKDLSQRILLNRTYDYIMSVQVGQHITAKNEFNFIWNLCRYAERGIVITWAMIGTNGGYHHNQQSMEHVTGRIEAFGFKLNKRATYNFKQNMLASYPYLRDDLLIFDRVLTKTKQSQYLQQGAFPQV